MNRRHFLATSPLATATLAAATAASTIPIRAADTPPTPIPIGFLGVSYSHGPDKLRLAMTSPDWELVGVWDESSTGRETCRKLGAPLLPRDEVLRRARVIAVESEIRHHAAHTLLALEAGRHVHAEKPPATTLAEVRAMTDLARSRNLLLQTGFMWRFNPGFRAVFDAVRNGWLGEVFFVRACMNNHLQPAGRAGWAEFPGGSMFEQGSHLVDAVVRLLGKPTRVTPFLRHHGPFDDTLRDNNIAVLEFDRATAVLTNTALQVAGTPQRTFEVLGTRGSAFLGPVEPPTLTFELAQPAGPHPKGTHRIPLPAYRRYVGDFAELAAAVRGERPLSVPLDQEQLVAETVLLASEMGQELRIPR
jgi:predicted dehydrogenase